MWLDNVRAFERYFKGRVRAYAAAAAEQKARTSNSGKPAKRARQVALYHGSKVASGRLDEGCIKAERVTIELSGAWSLTVCVARLLLMAWSVWVIIAAIAKWAGIP